MTSSPRLTCERRPIRLPCVPLETKSAASLPAVSAESASRRCTVGSSFQTSSPTSASSMARRMAGVGRVKVSLRSSTLRRVVTAAGRLNDDLASYLDEAHPLQMTVDVEEGEGPGRASMVLVGRASGIDERDTVNHVEK